MEELSEETCIQIPKTIPCGQVEDQFLIQYPAFTLNEYFACNHPGTWERSVASGDHMEQHGPSITEWLRSGTVLATSDVKDSKGKERRVRFRYELYYSRERQGFVQLFGVI